MKHLSPASMISLMRSRGTSPRAAALWCALLAVLLAPNVWLSCVEPMTPWARAANILAPGGAYVLLLAAIRRPAIAVWALFPLVFLSAFQLVLLYLYGHSIIAVDMFLNLVTTNTAEVGELLGSLLPAMAGVTVVFVPLLWTAVRGLGRGRSCPGLGVLWRRRSALAGAATLLAGLLCTGWAHLSGPYSPLDQMYPLNVGYNIYLAAWRTGLSQERPQACSGYRFDARPTHADSIPEIYVMVIGETARAADFSLLGYSRPTTPRLDTIAGVIGFANAYTQSNTTHKSVPMLMSAATADDFERLYTQRGILSAMKEAGFHTLFLSNQEPNHSFIDQLGREADEARSLKDETPAPGAQPGHPDDDLLAPLAKAIGGGHRKLFAVLHTYGSHYKYHQRYPRRQARFVPDEASQATAAHRETLLNAYDNSILYTDSVLSRIISLIDSTRACGAMLYASDHGENIFDDSRQLFLHASPRPSAWELHVPMIAWLSPGYRASWPQEAATLGSHRGDSVYTSQSVFHTMLGIAGVDTPVLVDSLSLTSPAFHPGPFRYLSDRNIPVPIGQIML